MATIRAYTTIEQSLKLAEFLPLESADMEYMFLKKDGSKVSNVPFVKDGFEESECCYTFIPCWSLAALIDIIPKRIKEDNVLRIDVGEKDTSIWYDEIGCGVNTELPDITMECPVDACVEMIEKLNERKML